MTAPTRASAPSLGGEPCPVARADAPGATGSPGSLAIGGTLSVDGGASPQTIDARKPQADVSAKSLEIRTSDGKLDLTAQKLESQAAGACDANRQPVFSTSGDPGKVTLNGRMVSTSSDYSEPGVGVNGAPLFG